MLVGQTYFTSINCQQVYLAKYIFVQHSNKNCKAHSPQPVGHFPGFLPLQKTSHIGSSSASGEKFRESPAISEKAFKTSLQ